MTHILKRYLSACLLLSVACAAAFAQEAPLASFRFFEKWDSRPFALKEVSRLERMSQFQVSDPATNDVRALFILCNLAEYTEKRGFSHFAVIQPKDGDIAYTLGLYHSADEELSAAFGKDVDTARVLARRPGPVAKLIPMCPKKPAG